MKESWEEFVERHMRESEMINRNYFIENIKTAIDKWAEDVYDYGGSIDSRTRAAKACIERILEILK